MATQACKTIRSTLYDLGKIYNLPIVKKWDDTGYPKGIIKEDVRIKFIEKI